MSSPTPRFRCPLNCENESPHAYNTCALFTGQELLIWLDVKDVATVYRHSQWSTLTAHDLIGAIEGMLGGPFTAFQEYLCNGTRVAIPDDPRVPVAHLGITPGAVLEVRCAPSSEQAAVELDRERSSIDARAPTVATCDSCRDRRYTARPAAERESSAVVVQQVPNLGAVVTVVVVGSPRARTVHVGNIPVGFRRRDLQHVLSEFGTVLRIRIRGQPDPTNVFTFAFVEYATVAEAEACLQARQLTCQERTLPLSRSRDAITNVEATDAILLSDIEAIAAGTKTFADIRAFQEGTIVVLPCVIGNAEVKALRCAALKINTVSMDASKKGVMTPLSRGAAPPASPSSLSSATPPTLRKVVAGATSQPKPLVVLPSIAPYHAHDALVDGLVGRLRQMQAAAEAMKLDPMHSCIADFNALRTIAAFSCFIYAQKPYEIAAFRALDCIEEALRCLSPLMDTLSRSPAATVYDRTMMLLANLCLDALQVAIKVAMRSSDAIDVARAAIGGHHPGSLGGRLTTASLPPVDSEIDLCIAIVLLVEELDPEAAQELLHWTYRRVYDMKSAYYVTLLLHGADGVPKVGRLRDALVPGVSSFVLSYLNGNSSFKTVATVEVALRGGGYDAEVGRAAADTAANSAMAEAVAVAAAATREAHARDVSARPMPHTYAPFRSPSVSSPLAW